MRWPTRHEVYYVSWGTAGLGLLFAGVAVLSHASADLSYLGLGVSALAAFVGAYTFVVTRRLSQFGSKVALWCLVGGWVPVALLESVQLDPVVYSVVTYSLLAIGILGFVYVEFVEIPITMPKRPGSSRRGRLLDIGLLMIIIGIWIAFTRWFSLPIPGELYVSFFSPLALTGKVSFIAGIVVFSLAVLRARKHYVSERNREPSGPTEAPTNFPNPSKSQQNTAQKFLN